MQTLSAKPRNLVGLVLIALLLGPTSLMLWLGRWRASLLYVFAVPAIIGLHYAFHLFKFFRPFTNLGLEDAYTIIGLAVSAIGLVHAIRIRKSASHRPWYSHWYVALPGPLVSALLVAFLVRTFFYQPFNIPSAAMYPTLEVGDYLFVSKLSYGYSKYSFNFSFGGSGTTWINCCPIDFPGRVVLADSPKLGDVAVFKLPTNTDINYIKRVIGLPGDRIQMRDGVLFINGEAVKKERVEDYVDNEPLGEGGGRRIQQYEETLPNGVKYRVLDEQPGSTGLVDNTEEYVVPAEHYFMMGDNRDNSEDSRFLNAVGYVPIENFVGPVVLRFWTRKGFSLESWPQEIHPSN